MADSEMCTAEFRRPDILQPLKCDHYVGHVDAYHHSRGLLWVNEDAPVRLIVDPEIIERSLDELGWALQPAVRFTGDIEAMRLAAQRRSTEHVKEASRILYNNIAGLKVRTLE